MRRVPAYLAYIVGVYQHIRKLSVKYFARNFNIFKLQRSENQQVKIENLGEYEKARSLRGGYEVVKMETTFSELEIQSQKTVATLIVESEGRPYTV